MPEQAKAGNFKIPFFQEPPGLLASGKPFSIKKPVRPTKNLVVPIRSKMS